MNSKIIKEDQRDDIYQNLEDDRILGNMHRGFIHSKSGQTQSIALFIRMTKLEDEENQVNVANLHYHNAFNTAPAKFKFNCR